MPNAVPSPDIALERKSGCENRMAMLMAGSAVCTRPTTPSGETTGLYTLIPARLPAVRVSVVTTSSRTALCTASAGTKPVRSRAPRPSSFLSSSFSLCNATALNPRMTAVSRRAVRSSLSCQAACQRSALLCRFTSGATTERRSTSARGSRICSGSTRATAAAIRQPMKRRKSTRLLSRVARATAPPPSGAQDRPVLLFVVEDSAGAAHDARERILIDVDRQAGLLTEKEIETADERTAAGHDNAAIDDVTGELGRRDLECASDSVDDRLHRLLDRLTNLARVHSDGLGNSGHEIAAFDLHLALLADGRGRTDLNLDLFGRRLADE